ncbi:MAG TPA: hypothetical protein VEL79_14305, partial [Vicinamibacterales bacterium]|nr:hypothetical protein [Vicinamibacterales bacterium]
AADANALGDDTIVFERRSPEGTPAFLVVARLRGAGQVTVPELLDGAWDIVLTTEDQQFADDGMPPAVDHVAGCIRLARPGAVLFQRTSGASEPATEAERAAKSERSEGSSAGCRGPRHWNNERSGDHGVPASKRAEWSGANAAAQWSEPAGVQGSPAIKKSGGGSGRAKPPGF